MPKYVIERDFPGAGSLSAADLYANARTSNEAVASLAPRVQWQHSYVTTDKVYCVFIAEDEDVVLEHARLGGFPITTISKVASLIDPTTGEAGGDR